MNTFFELYFLYTVLWVKFERNIFYLLVIFQNKWFEQFTDAYVNSYNLPVISDYKIFVLLVIFHNELFEYLTDKYINSYELINEIKCLRALIFFI